MQEELLAETHGYNGYFSKDEIISFEISFRRKIATYNGESTKNT